MKNFCLYLCAVLLLATWLCETKAQQAKISNEVLLNITVVNKKRAIIDGLKAEHFSIFDNGKEQKITSFFHKDEPLSVGILLDASGSMKGSLKYRLAVAGLQEFLVQSNPRNEYFVFAFNKKPQLLLDATQNAKQVIETLDKAATAEPYGNTAIYDAIYFASDKISRAKYSKRVLFVVSDGAVDNFSTYKRKDVEQEFKNADFSIYVVNIMDSEDKTRFQLDGETRDAQIYITKLIALRGGEIFYPPATVKAVDWVFRQIAAELRSQYTIGFAAPGSANDDKARKLEVKINVPKEFLREKGKLLARSRTVYFPSSNLAIRTNKE